jgi:IMP dehydrogenase/GMP reductase
MAAEGLEPPEGTEFAQVVPEGVEATVPHRGEASLVVHRLVGGLRSAMSYADAHTIAEFHANARFVRITTAGLIESRPHDLS